MYSLKQLADVVDGKIIGDAQATVNAVASLGSAKPGDITYLDNPQYRSQLAKSDATCVLITNEYQAQVNTNAIIVSDSKYAFAKIAECFSSRQAPKPGIHPSVVMGEGTSIDASATVGPNVVLGDNVSIAAHCVIGANSTLGDNVSIGEHTMLWPNVTIYHDCAIGRHSELHSSSVIGADGFGLVKHNGQWTHFPQLGGVQIGDYVSIGANTCIDRGAINDTIIGNDVKIDNLCQIAHNVEIGDHTAIAGCSGIAGSTKIGKHCLFGANVGVAGHLTIADNVSLTARCSVAQSISEGTVLSSAIYAKPHRQWIKILARIFKLERLFSRMTDLEKIIKELRHDAKLKH